jgi:hypothetical protein
MNTCHVALKRITKLGILLMMGVSMSACASLSGLVGASWKEEVLLHDGSKIFVERSVERSGRHEIGQKPSFKEQRLTFTIPGTSQEVVWEDHFSEEVGSSNFLPMLVDIYNGTPYLVASTLGCLSYNKWGRPNPPYIVFKYVSKNWQRVPLTELPGEIKTPNLIFSMPDIKVEESGKRFMSAEVIKAIIAGYKQPEFKTILREPLPKGSIGITTCEELIHYKCGWISPHGTFGRNLMDNTCK